MKRYFNIFLNYFQIVLTERGRSFVWFLMSTIPALVTYLYWRAVFLSRPASISGWNLSSITSYYFLLIIAASVLIAHIEEDVSNDVKKGELTSYILKPFPYLISKLFTETPYRILQGFYALIPILILIYVFKNPFALSANPTVLILAIITAIMGYLLSFIFKMVLGLLALWLTEARGLFQLLEALMYLFGGYLLPITLLPGGFQKIANLLPFSFMLYYPITSFQGKYNVSSLAIIILVQVIWFIIFFLLYKWAWNTGIKKYTGVGN
jgi:ABC-2 type transport system permease protein